MAIYRTVSMSFWTDNKVTDDFTPEDRYFYLYLFTNPHTNLCGCYEISIKQIANEMGYSKDTVENLIERFEKVHKVLQFSKSTKEILLLNWSKYNWTSSEKFRKPLEKEIATVKDLDFRAFLENIFLNGYRIDTTYIDTNCIDTSVTVTDNNNIYSFSNNSNINNFIYVLKDYIYKDYINSNPDLMNCLKEWFEYKDSKKPKANNHYGTKLGMEKLLKKVVDKCKEYGVQAVVETINDTIANNYQGIVWNWLEKKRGNYGNTKPERRNTRTDDVEIDPEREEILAYWREREGMQ